MGRTSRRDFIKTTAAGLGAVGAARTVSVVQTRRPIKLTNESKPDSVEGDMRGRRDKRRGQ